MDHASRAATAVDRNTSPGSQPALSQASSSRPDRVFTPPLPPSNRHRQIHHIHKATHPNHRRVGAADTDMTGHSTTAENLHGASQLMLLAEKAGFLADGSKDAASGGSSPGAPSAKKRTLDGAFKESSTSPVKRLAPVRPSRAHSRSVSNASMASTMSWTVPEAPAKLTATLKYAMQKVQRGWQDFSIDEVETLASRQAAPRRASTSTSSSTTTTFNTSNTTSNTTNTSNTTSNTSNTTSNTSTSTSTSNTAAPHISHPMPAPPMSIQKGVVLPPPSSNPHSVSALLNPDPPARTTGPHTPSHRTGHHQHLQHHHLQHLHTRTNPGLAPVLFSGNPQSHNVREQDAIASLLFMSSPGNTASLKRHPAFSPDPTAQSLPPQAMSFPQPTPARIPLPESAPHARRPLPSQKPPAPHRHSHSASLAVGKRPPVDRSPASRTHDADSPASARKPKAAARPGSGAPHSLGGGSGSDGGEQHQAATERRPFSKPAGLGTGQAPRRKLTDKDIEDMLEGVSRAVPAADSDSDDEGEIVVPPRARIPLPA